MFLLCCYDVMFTLETENIQHKVLFGLRDLSVMSLCRKCEPGLILHTSRPTRPQTSASSKRNWNTGQHDRWFSLLSRNSRTSSINN